MNEIKEIINDRCYWPKNASIQKLIVIYWSCSKIVFDLLEIISDPCDY